MSDQLKVVEECCCGASIEVEGTWATDVASEMTRFRADHRHERITERTVYEGAPASAVEGE